MTRNTTKKTLIFIGNVTILATITTIPSDTFIGTTDQFKYASGALVFGDINEILNAIPAGKEALELKDMHNIQVRFKSGHGTYFDFDSNTIVIDSEMTSVRAALLFVHEMIHAERFHGGLTPNINTFSKEEYVEGRLKEEAKAEAKACLLRSS